MILNLLAPEPSPPGAFEPVTVGRVGKTAFHEMPAAFPIAAGGRALGSGARTLHVHLPIIALNPTAAFGLGTLRA